MAAAKKTSKKKTPASKKTTKKKSAASSARTTSKKKKKTTKTAAPKKTTKSKTKKKSVEKAATVKKTTKSVSKKTPKAAAATEAPKVEKKPAAKPKKPAFDAEFLKQVRDSLVDERRSLLSMMQSTQQQLAGRDTGLADLSDIASGGFEDELAIGLMASEAATLEKIDAAIRRIDDGSYGICLDCEKPIPKKRLEFLPFAQRCMECEGNRERRVRMGTIND